MHKEVKEFLIEKNFKEIEPNKMVREFKKNKGGLIINCYDESASLKECVYEIILSFIGETDISSELSFSEISGTNLIKHFDAIGYVSWNLFQDLIQMNL